MTPRAARPDEADTLTALCIRSKAHWGYDAASMAQAAPHLTIPPDLIAARRVFVSEESAGHAAGVVALSTADARGAAELVLLFVDPPFIGQGHGRRLMTHALRIARNEGARRLGVLSDPFAAPFYRAMGATDAGMAPSDAIAGRLLPRLEWRLR